ncbi:hypothetical protein DXG03_007373 [Asterophora parasitica]|uniref:F-box domain-containing protein n=1 Tax=Asterophora parasitica TaxID=117018 RepID=A0A9P7G4M0_9AGAR|nr:hypothetical protein DXG03_007373 [Asterophora parasitica]
MTVFSRLPPEIIDNVIDRLSHSFSDLHSCSVANSKFTPRCQRHLFYRACLIFPDDINDPAENTQHLIRLLRPDLARSIRYLRIINYHQSRSGTAEDAHLAMVLEKLCISLQSFTLSGVAVTRRNATVGFTGTQLSPSLFSCLIAMFVSTQVVEVNLHNIKNLPTPLLASHCPSIRHVSFEGSTSPGTAPFPEENLLRPAGPLWAGQEPRFLNVLSLSPGALQCAMDFCAASGSESAVDLSHLNEIIIIGYSSKLIDFAADCMRRAGESLKTLRWSPCHTDTGITGVSILLRVISSCLE